MTNIFSNQERLVLSLQDALDNLFAEGRIEEAAVWSKMLLEALQGLGAISGKTLSPVATKSMTTTSASPYRTQQPVIKPQESREYQLAMDAAYVKRARELAELPRVQKQAQQPGRPVVSSYSYNDGMRDPKNLRITDYAASQVRPDEGDYTPAATYTYDRNTQQQIQPQQIEQQIPLKEMELMDGAYANSNLSELDVWEDDPRRQALNNTNTIAYNQ